MVFIPSARRSSCEPSSLLVSFTNSPDSLGGCGDRGCFTFERNVDYAGAQSEHHKKPARYVRSQDGRFNIETEREVDSRWIAEIGGLPGALAYGKTEAEARAKAYAIALRAITKTKTSPQVLKLNRRARRD